jgi:hypothetical protein
MAGPSPPSAAGRMSEKHERWSAQPNNPEIACIQREVALFGPLMGNSEKGMFKAGVEVLSVLRDVVRLDFKDNPIDSVPWMNAAVFGATFHLFGPRDGKAC